MAGGEHEPEPGGIAHHQQLQLAQRLVRAQLGHVVYHKPDLVLQPVQVFQQPLDDPRAKPPLLPPPARPPTTRRAPPEAELAEKPGPGTDAVPDSRNGPSAG